MVRINNFSLAPILRADGESTETSELLFDGQVVGQVDGLLIEQQFKIDTGFLLFNTHDCPYEEALSISYLNSTFEILDNRLLYGYYSTGTLRDVRVCDKNRVQFSFFAEDLWELTVFPHPRFTPSQWGLAGYVHPYFLISSLMDGRSFKRRHLKLKMLANWNKALRDRRRRRID
jgi:hypothetical protein